MESPRTGIVILLLVAVSSLAGGLLGWQLRPPAVASAPPDLSVGGTSDQPAGVGVSENRWLETGGYRKSGDIPGSGFEKPN